MVANTEPDKATQDRVASVIRRGSRYLRSRLLRYSDRLHEYSLEKYRGLSLKLVIVRRITLIRTTFVAVTGSVGKTTAASLAHAILSSEATCHAMGGRNSVYASTLAVRSVDRSFKFCVQEIGADAPGTIAQHVRVLRPDIGIVTTIGSDHYKNYRSLETTAREKGQLVERLAEERRRHPQCR